MIWCCHHELSMLVVVRGAYDVARICFFLVRPRRGTIGDDEDEYIWLWRPMDLHRSHVLRMRFFFSFPLVVMVSIFSGNKHYL